MMNLIFCCFICVSQCRALCVVIKRQIFLHLYLCNSTVECISNAQTSVESHSDPDTDRTVTVQTPPGISRLHRRYDTVVPCFDLGIRTARYWRGKCSCNAMPRASLYRKGSHSRSSAAADKSRDMLLLKLLSSLFPCVDSIIDYIAFIYLQLNVC